MINILKDKDCIQLLENNYIGHMAYIYRKRPFIAPITYFFDKENNFIIGYSAEGHKINALRKNKQVALEVSEIESVNDWNSIVVHGTFEEVDGSVAKSYLHKFSLGVKHLIIKKKQKELDFISQFSSKSKNDDIPIVFIIKIQEITGKIRRH